MSILEVNAGNLFGIAESEKTDTKCDTKSLCIQLKGKNEQRLILFRRFYDISVSSSKCTRCFIIQCTPDIVATFIVAIRI